MTRTSYLVVGFAGAMSSMLVAYQFATWRVPVHAVADAPAQALAPLIAGDYLVAGPGRVEPASEEIAVTASITGVIKEVDVKEGQQVHRGDILARLEDEDYVANLVKAQAQLKLRDAELQLVVNGARQQERQAALATVDEAEAVEVNAELEYRRQKLLGANAVSSKSAVDQAQMTLDTARDRHRAAIARYALLNDPARQEDVTIAQAQVDAARAEVAAVQATLDKSAIRSPIDGTVLRVFRHPGELLSVFIDQPLLSLGDVSKLYVRAEIDEADIANLQSDLPAYVTAEAYGDRHFNGHVLRIGEVLGQKRVSSQDPKDRADTKVLEVLIALDMPNPLRPGLRVNAFLDRPTDGPPAQGKE